MADDREVLREIWEGKVPVCFNLAPNECAGSDNPEPLYLLVPRQSYFPLVTDKVEKHFQKYIDPDLKGEMWLEDAGLPLKWHSPIGVLFDLSGAESRLPWSLTVHFQKFPESELLHCPSIDAVEAHFMSMVKEADCLKHRSQVINNMQKRDHNQLWSGLQNDKFDQFWSVNRKLMEHSGDDLFKHIPFRIYQGDSKPFTQCLFRPVTQNGVPHTLLDLLRDVTSIPSDLDNSELSSNYKIKIQGINPPLDAPLQWLSEHFSHPDNFLHICVLPL